MTGITQQLTVLAQDIRAGDVFDRHRRTWTASGAAGWGPYESVCVPVDGGVVFFPRDTEVVVSRLARRVPCATE
ncbi:hypothetical protein [Streptomyces niveus]|uniref:hypothetical protein n=1 Tax=Streptomyces niveus TaxID=193462 RepID=UPI00386CA161